MQGYQCGLARVVRNPVEVVYDRSDLFERRRHLLDECFRIKGRTTWYTSAEETQRDLDQYLTFYNLKRSHQGRTPAQALREALGREKLPSSFRLWKRRCRSK